MDEFEERQKKLEKVFPPFSDENKKKIIDNILKEVDEQGTARVGHHAEKILFSMSKPLPYHILSKIEGTIIKTNKYSSRKHPKISNDFEIFANANYKEKSFIEKHPYWHAIIIACLGALISQGISKLFQTKSDQEQTRIDNQQDLRLKNLSDSLSNLQIDKKDSAK
jgi:hypothetical protein